MNDALALEMIEYPDMWTIDTIPFIVNPIVINWVNDYWKFVSWNEHGNECALTEIDFFGMLCDIIAYESDRYDTRDYLIDYYYKPDLIARMNEIRLMLTEINFLNWEPCALKYWDKLALGDEQAEECIARLERDLDDYLSSLE